jgi:SAM-dependent methyltransferase
VVARGLRGTFTFEPVVVGSTYAVRLYKPQASHPIAEAVVTRNFWPRPRDPDAAPAGYPPREPIDFGDLRRIAPVSPEYGFDRGQPIDRYYIERFLAKHAADIHGRVLEVQDTSYASHFGGERVESIAVLDNSTANPVATIVADLNEPVSLPASAFDCVILTQVLPVIRSLDTAVLNVRRCLRDGGVLLATFPGISQLTPNSALQLFGQCFAADDLLISAPGNPLSATAFLFGIASDELSHTELDQDDPRYDVVICVRARKGTATHIAT